VSYLDGEVDEGSGQMTSSYKADLLRVQDYCKSNQPIS